MWKRIEREVMIRIAKEILIVWTQSCSAEKEFDAMNKYLTFFLILRWAFYEASCYCVNTWCSGSASSRKSIRCWITFHDNGESFCCDFMSYATRVSHRRIFSFIIRALPYWATIKPDKTTVYTGRNVSITKTFWCHPKNEVSCFKRRKKRITNSYDCDIKSTRSKNFCICASKGKESYLDN